MKKLIVLFSSILIGISCINSQNPTAKIVQVADSLFMLSNLGANVSFLITNEGVVVVDEVEFPAGPDIHLADNQSQPRVLDPGVERRKEGQNLGPLWNQNSRLVSAGGTHIIRAELLRDYGTH